jgi:hypothetical protein
MAIYGRSRKGPGCADDALLDRAIRSWKAAAIVEAEGHLSQATRAAVIEAAINTAPARPSPKAWLAVGFGAVFTVTLGVLLLGGGGESGRPLTIQAEKAGSEVVFTISNGHRAHRVIKSTDAERISAGMATVEDGRFRDLSESGPVLVFYRVD